MKKIYVNTFCFFSLVAAYAQPTLTGADLNPVLGEEITISQGSYTNPGPSGSNQTWDFSSVLTSGSGTFLVGPSDAAHPGTNVSYDYGGGNKFWLQNDASKQEFKYQQSAGVLITFSDNQKILQFPLSSTTSVTDPFAATFTSGVAFSRQGNSTLTYEGFGTVTTPTGTYTNCLKMKLVQIYTDTYVGGTISYNVVVYYWYKAGYHYPIVTLGSYTTNGGAPTEYSQFYAGSTLNLNENPEIETVLYPNPATHEIHFEVANEGAVEAIKVYDVKGHLIHEVVEAMDGQATIQLSDFNAGFYFLEAQLSNGSVVRKKFQKV